MGEVRWRARPLRGDDRVELRPEEVRIGQQQVEELLLGAAPVIDAARRTDLRHHYQHRLSVLDGQANPESDQIAGLYGRSVDLTLELLRAEREAARAEGERQRAEAERRRADAMEAELLALRRQLGANGSTEPGARGDD